MSDNVKTKLISFLIGFMVGSVLAVVGGAVLYKSGALKKKVLTAVSNRITTNKQDKVINARVYNPYPSRGAHVFAASSLDRIFADGATLVQPDFTDKVVISLARHEYESFQIVVSHRDIELNDVSLNVSELVHEETGQVLDSENLEWWRVDFVPTKKPYYPVKYVGEWPDPLMPADEPFNLEVGKYQPFWFTLYAPRKTLPGNYRAKIQVYANGGLLKTIPFEVRVYGFTLPRESHLKTAFDLYPHITRKRFYQGKQETDEAYQARIKAINEEYIIKMLKYRMNPVLNVDPGNQDDLRRVDNFRWHGLNNFSIGRRGGTFNNNWPKTDKEINDLIPLYRRYGELLALNKWLDYQYIYTWDEGKIGNPLVPKLTKMIHTAHPKLKNMVCYHGIWEPDKHPGWGDDIDIWCFHIDDYDERKLNVLRERGIELWMYVSGPGGTGAPNLGMDFDSVDYRIIPWMSWKYDWEGFLYWCVNWWPKVDPFTSAANTKWAQNGNGLLFYPGKKGPLGSLRAEVYRDGMEDYEYLHLLKEYVQRIESKGLKESLANLYTKGQQYLTIDEALIKSTEVYVQDGQALKQRRDTIAELIEQLEEILQ